MAKKSIFEEYAKLSIQLADLEKKKEELQVKCLAEMQKQKEHQVRIGLGVFSLIERKSYTYSDQTQAQVKAMKEDIKKVENNAIQLGSAILEIKESLRFQGI